MFNTNHILGGKENRFTIVRRQDKDKVQYFKARTSEMFKISPLYKKKNSPL